MTWGKHNIAKMSFKQILRTFMFNFMLLIKQSKFFFITWYSIISSPHTLQINTLYVYIYKRPLSTIVFFL